MSLLSVKQNAEFWGFSETWIYRHRLELHGFKVGSSIRFDTDKQKELLSRHRDRTQAHLNFKFHLTKGILTNNVISEVKELARKTKKSTTRHYGYGSVYKRKKGKSWTMDFYNEDGNRIQKAIPQATCRDEAVLALQRELSLIFDRAHGIDVEPKQESIGFKTFAKIYHEDYMKINRRNFRPDTYRLQTLSSYFKDTDLRNLTPLDIERFRAVRIKKGNSKSTTNRYLQLLKRMFNLAIEEKYLSENILNKVRCFSEKDNLRERILTEEEEIKLIENSSENLKPIIAVALNTGMRRAEILNLTWKQIDFESRRIKVEKTKSGRVRYIPINEIVNLQLGILKAENGQNPFVFLNPKTGKPFLDMKTPFKKACRISGIEGLRFHDLRHTFASRLIERGVDIETARDLLGHSSLLITQRYIHSNDDRKRLAVEILLKKREKEVNMVTNGDNLNYQSELIS